MSLSASSTYTCGYLASYNNYCPLQAYIMISINYIYCIYNITFMYSRVFGTTKNFREKKKLILTERGGLQ